MTDQLAAVRAVLRDVRRRVGNGVMVALGDVTERIEGRG